MPRRSRYREAQERRAEQQRKADRALRSTTQVASLGVLIAFAVTIMAVLKGPSAFAPLEPLTRPLIFGVTSLELIGFAFVAWVGLVIWRRMRK